MKKCTFYLYFFVVLLFECCGQGTDNTIKTPVNNSFTAKLELPDLRNPWGIVFLRNEGILVSEKEGKLLHFKNGKRIEVKGLPEILVRGQGGLLDLELHPNYEENGWIYLSYASPKGEGRGGNTAIMRAKLKAGELINKEVLYKGIPNSTKSQHWGSRLEFDNEGYLYFTIGDRGNRDINPQDIKRDGGKVYRIHDDGQIPKDNPFVGISKAKEAIFSYGHRNLQGLTRHPETGAIWSHEHGPRGGDEINIVQKGKNYGWPIITYGINYIGTKITEKTAQKGMEQPLHYWVPSIAPSGMTFVSSDRYKDWKGSLLVGSLAFQYLERLVLKKGRVVRREKLMDGIGRVRNVRQGPDGYIYVAVEGKGIFKLIPK